MRVAFYEGRGQKVSESKSFCLTNWSNGLYYLHHFNNGYKMIYRSKKQARQVADELSKQAPLNSYVVLEYDYLRFGYLVSVVPKELYRYINGTIIHSINQRRYQ